MPICSFCRLYDFRYGDRYCGLCGGALCQLVFKDGLYVEIDEDAKGTVQKKVKVFNNGRSPLNFNIKESTDGVVNLHGSSDLILEHIEDSVELTFDIDVDELKSRSKKYCYVDFDTTDPLYKRGMIRFGLATDSKVVVENEKINLDELIATRKGGSDRHISHFSVSLSNRGGEKVNVTIQPWRDSSDFPIQIDFKNGKNFELEGYCNNVSVEFIAWTSSEEKGELKDKLVLVFNEKKDAQIELIAKCVQPPVLTVVSLPKFKNLVAGKVVDDASGQTRIGILELKNSGGSPFTITEIISDSPLLQPIPDQLPLEIFPGIGGASIEFIMSTRIKGKCPKEAIKMPFSLWLKTDSPYIEDRLIRGDAELTCPVNERGLMAVDFGTINSCVAFLDDDPDSKPVPIVNRDELTKESFVPSMMLFISGLFKHEEWLLSGVDAKKRAFSFPRGVIHSVKRAIEEGDWRIYEETYHGSQLAAWIIEQLLLESTRCYNCCPSEVVMTIPAAFWGPKRTAMEKACKEACRLAWGKSEEMLVRLIDEPTAVAMYYYSVQKELILTKLKEKQKFHTLVFDFGGGTLDISIVQFYKDSEGSLTVQPIISRGDNNLGGIDIDLALSSELVKEVKKRCKNFNQKSLDSSRWEFEREFRNCKGFGALQSMRLQWYQNVKEAKEKLSDKKAVEFIFSLFHDSEGKEILGNDKKRFEFKYEITEDRFKIMISSHLERAKKIVQSTLDSISLQAEDVDVLLMTGQSNKIPCFRESIYSLFSNPPFPGKKIPLKESVSLGAAYAAREKNLGRIKVNELKCSSYRYGIEGVKVPKAKEKFIELIPFRSPFGEEKKSASISTSHAGYFYIIQSGIDSNTILPNETDLDVTYIGKINIPRNCKGTSNFSLFFCGKTGILSAELDGKKIQIEPMRDNASKAIYL